jgi:DNA-binding NarL/FixJ family response regulator
VVHVLEMVLVTGASNKIIADRLGVSVLTVKRHLSNIFTKLNITSRMQLAIRYTQPLKAAIDDSSKSQL